jgi:hypothetical protein
VTTIPTAERTDIPADVEPGFTMYEVRKAIRDLRRQIGFEMTREYVAGVLLDEGGARTIEHERH